MSGVALPVINLQHPEKRVVREAWALDVVDVFPTIQGEGPYVGMPAIFVRLAGCNLQCPLCDTDYTSNRRLVDLDGLVGEIKELSKGVVKLVVITGGEPSRQECGPLVNRLLSMNMLVQFETNGTLYDSSMEGIHADVTIVCSPKTSGLHRELIPVIDVLKYVVSADRIDKNDGLPTSSLGLEMEYSAPARPWPGFAGEVYVQPCDSRDEAKNRANLEAAIDSCMKYGYRLCLQTHKIAGLP